MSKNADCCIYLLPCLLPHHHRVKSTEIALEKAAAEVKGSVLASDAFFPFSWGDSVEMACKVSSERGEKMMHMYHTQLHHPPVQTASRLHCRWPWRTVPNRNSRDMCACTLAQRHLRLFV